MARSKRPRSTLRRRTKKRRAAAPERPAASTPWPNIEWFLAQGEGNVSLGAIDYVPTLRYTAVVSDEHNMLVALVRRPRETLHELLDRLETALGPALEDSIFIDEINAPSGQ